MSAGGYLDGCGFIPVSTGTGDFVVSAAVQGYQTPASAVAVNATVYTYRAESADKSQWEIGFGAYTTGTTTLARTTVLASSTGAKVSFSAAPNIYVTAAKADLQNASLLNSGTVPVSLINGGTANQFVQGDGTFQTQPRKLLNTLTAANSPTLSDTSSLTSTFPAYELVFNKIVPATTNTTLELQVHSGGAFKATGYIASTFSNAGSTTVSSSQPTTFIQLSIAAQVLNTDPGLSGSIKVYKPSASAIAMWEGKFAHSDSSTVANVITSGFWNTAGVVDGFQILSSSGNLTSGTIEVYGLV